MSKMRKMPARRQKRYWFMLLLAGIALLPVIYMLFSSFWEMPERKVSLMGYYHVFLAESGYLMKFWRSMGLCLVIATGQTIISCMAGTAFAKYNFIGKRMLFGIMLLFMLLPVQVTLLPNYILLEKLGFLNSWQALMELQSFRMYFRLWLRQ